MSEENFEAYAQMLRVAHGDEAMPPHSLRALLRMEVAAAALERRVFVFRGTRGPWLRLAAPAVRPAWTGLLAGMVHGGCVGYPHARGQ